MPKKMILRYLLLSCSFLFFSHMCAGTLLLKKLACKLALNFLVYISLSSCINISSKLIIIYQVVTEQLKRGILLQKNNELHSIVMRLSLILFTGNTSDLS